ncbi:LamG-like jellyroll fold domain-containing protein [Nonomuraea pusilla]|uniref:LamG-like jellyroll fold domain-containing protein n=1 Tax=Nonomuraea pusilla TaxID=46177 RepID=UPI0033192C8B
MKRDGSYVYCSAPAQELYYSIEDIVRAWAAGAPNYGLQIASYGDTSGGSNFREYLSSEWAGLDGRGPVLFVEYEAPDEPIGAVGWFRPEEAGIADREAIKAINDNPDLGRASDTLPVARDVTDEQAIAEKNSSTDEPVEVTSQEIIEQITEIDNPAPDATAPAVVRTDPSNGEIKPEVSNVYVTFDEDVTGVQITVKDASGTAVNGTLSSGATGAGWMLSFSAGLPPGTYTATARGAIDAAGNAMASPFEWSFTIGNPPSEGLVAAYGMEEGAGTTVGDSSGEGNAGTATSATWTAGKYGNALSFTGTNGSWVTIPHRDSLRLTAGMTISAWVMPSVTNGYRTLVMKDHANGSAYGLYASNGTAPSAWMLKSDNSGSHAIIDGTTALPTGTWSHVAATYDGATARLYVNGIQVAQTAASGPLLDDGGALHIAGNTRWGEYFAGAIDEVRIYNRPQTAEQIQTDMNTPIVKPPSARSTRTTAAVVPTPDNPPPKVADVFERLTPAKCAEKENLAGRPQGWIMNHFSWCQMGKVEAYWSSGKCVVNTTPCVPEPPEYFTATVMLIGYTFNGVVGVERVKGDTPRDTVVEVYLYNGNTYGRMPPTKKMTLMVDIGNKNRCDVVTSRGGQAVSNQRTSLISDWILNGRATFRFRCDPKKAGTFRTNEWVTPTKVRNDEQVSITTFRASANFPDWPNTQWRYVTPVNRTVIGNVVRCDSASYITFISGGCVFYKTKPAVKWVYSATSKDGRRTWQFKQAFQHYWNACTDPDGQTYPDKPDKNIFGCDVGNGTSYLHREAKTQRNANQTDTNTRCNRMWPGYTNGTDPDPANWKQCDEFPFASTMERTLAPAQRDFSLCPIRAQHNGDAGAYLDRFYNADRVLIADQFTNRFDTSDNDPISRQDLCGTPTNPN